MNNRESLANPIIIAQNFLIAGIENDTYSAHIAM